MTINTDEAPVIRGRFLKVGADDAHGLSGSGSDLRGHEAEKWRRRDSAELVALDVHELAHFQPLAE
jgi:hypothetical protein